MKLFDEFEAVKFYQENLIFVTHNGYLYYIYSPRNKHWRKQRQRQFRTAIQRIRYFAQRQLRLLRI